VLYDGKIQEAGPTDTIINHASKDYTRRLMAAVRPTPSSDLAADAREKTEHAPAMEVKDVTAGYGRNMDGSPKVTVLRDVNVKIKRGHVVGVIGESGCGKSTLARVMAGLLPASEGEVLLDGEALPPTVRQRSREQLRRVQFIFQMADTALNPRHNIREIVGRPLEFYRGIRGRERTDKVVELLKMVDLTPDMMSRFPSELSGGQKQRVALARALAAEAEVFLCDEVTSALDTIVGAAVIKLLRRLRDRLGVSYVFISHDLSTVASFADEIVVLYAGRVVEQGPVQQILSPPYHPYTRLLIASVPELRIGWLEDTMSTREAMAGIAGAVDLNTKGCPFHPRCPLMIEGTCDVEVPPNRMDAGGEHVIACHVDFNGLSAEQGS